MASLTRQWWRRTATAMKDKRREYISRVGGGGRQANIVTAVIRSTNHDNRSIDYKNAARVFSWARTSPACCSLLLRALTRRATRTRSWVVALKTLLLTHGILACSAAPCIGRLPFDLSDFRDRSTRPSVASYGFSAFVRAYFQFLDYRSVLLSSVPQFDKQILLPSDSVDQNLKMLAKMQDLLELLMQIQPYSDGMEVGLILEAMDCVIIEIFEVYSSICRTIARFLVDVLGPKSSTSSSSFSVTASSETKTDLTTEEHKRLGMALMRVLRTSVEQNEQLNSYFNLCRSLGVLNATEIPPVETISEENIRDLEALMKEDNPRLFKNKNNQKREEEKKGKIPSDLRPNTIVTMDWEVFEDRTPAAATHFVNSIKNPFIFLEAVTERSPVINSLT